MVGLYQREQLRLFLRNSRARLSPEKVGLSLTGRRTSRGLRREDVAALAGVSVTYFTWLEQGRDIHPSAAVLERLSTVLQLTPPERDYLFNLVQLRPPPPAPLLADELAPAVRRMLSTLNYPALVVTTRWEIVGWSELWVRCIADPGARPAHDRNLLRIVLTDPQFSRDPEAYEAIARRVLAKVRLDYSRLMGDPVFEALLQELNETCPTFRRLWTDPDVQGHSEGTVTHLTRVGEISFEHSSYVVEGAADLHLLIFVPSGEESIRKYATLLASGYPPTAAP